MNVRKHKRYEHGFSTIELSVVILVIIVLTILIAPRIFALVSGARLAGVRQEAAGIGAAIEILKIEGRYDPRDEDLFELIFEETGVIYEGELSELDADGGFVYGRTIGNEYYSARYDSSTGSVDGEIVGSAQ